MATSFRKKKAEKSQRSRPATDLADFVLNEDHQQAADAGLQLVVCPPACFYVDEQVRKTIDLRSIQERAASMRENGQIQPIVVYPADSQGKYKIDKGECRWRAAQLIEGFELSAVIDPQAPQRNTCKRIVGQIVENDQRSELQPLEMALALEALRREGMNMEAIATALGWISANNKPNINKVSRYLSIMKLPQEGKQLTEDGIVTDVITLELLRKIFVVNPTKFSALCNLARKDNGLSRKRVEQAYKQCKSPQHRGAESTHIPVTASTDKLFADNAKADALAPSTNVNTLPVINVLWNGIRQGTLVLDQQAAIAGEVLVRLDTGDLISVLPDELTLTAVILKRVLNN